MANWKEVVFLIYFISHVPITIFFDSQCVLPKFIYPQILQDVVVSYSVSMHDPFVLSPPAWYLSYCLCELLIQFPFFFVAIYAFWKGGCRWIRIPSLLYGTHVATTVIAIIYHILVADFTKSSESNEVLVYHGVTGPETVSERLILSSIYAPYLFVPLLMVYAMLFSPEYLPSKSKSH